MHLKSGLWTQNSQRISGLFIFSKDVGEGTMKLDEVGPVGWEVNIPSKYQVLRSNGLGENVF